ncbi:hypothetical protein D9615_007500 [Tricholomella constricta]|uniref:HNH nuclease domain-containing protein n=1 Tax=Tricholomella constricta TaxID=117010 RepID=A0A8H5H7T1_9AGAR|nr:hypothetical protein D9615_007500 [Tricholomella constricta]
MYHKQTSSIDRTSSSLRSLSSTSLWPLSSVISVRDEAFKAAVDDLKTGPTPLQRLVETATTLIDTIAAHEEENTFNYNGSKLQLHAVLWAMLYHAESCGGQGGKRYTASAISLCDIHDDPDSEKTFLMLRDLVTTWVSHLLFIFHTTASHSHSAQRNMTPSGLATPTREDTASLMDRGVMSKNRDGDFRGQLLLRDGYRCAVTGVVDINHPKKHQEREAFTLEGCHIIRRAIAVYNSEGGKDVYNSAVTTFDILRNFASLSSEAVQELENNIDDPSNGILLTSHAHSGFDRFAWCLQETETQDRYKVKVYDISHGIGQAAWADSKFVEFKDHSEKFQDDKGRKRGREISLPNPRYLRIHAAIAGILHMSGAGIFFDELLKRFGDGKGGSAVRSWEEFDREVETANLRKELSVLAV